jgi:hypothetical protein
LIIVSLERFAVKKEMKHIELRKKNFVPLLKTLWLRKLSRVTKTLCG